MRIARPEGGSAGPARNFPDGAEKIFSLRDDVLGEKYATPPQEMRDDDAGHRPGAIAMYDVLMPQFESSGTACCRGAPDSLAECRAGGDRHVACRLPVGGDLLLGDQQRQYSARAPSAWPTVTRTVHGNGGMMNCMLPATT